MTDPNLSPLNKLLVLKRDGENFQLPSNEYLTVKAPLDSPGGLYLMFRVINFSSDFGELYLKYDPAKCDANDFEISREVNAELFIAYKILKITIIDRRNNNYISNQNFNSDINLNQRLSNVKPSQFYEAAQSQEVKLKNYSINNEVFIPFKEIKFEDGKASFNTHINTKLGSRTFYVENRFLKKEFDSIKNYFEKVLGLKKIAISINVEAIGSEIINIGASSAHIDLIDENLIVRVENALVEDQYLYSDDEVFALHEKLEKTTKQLGIEEPNSVDWLLNKIVTAEKTKHYFHLRYLSSKHSSSSLHLRMTGKPTSFIFLIQHTDYYYLIWETYKTEEATYIWRISSENKNQLQNEFDSLIDRIKWLRKKNKLTYINSKPDNFIRIEHQYTGEDNGFKDWKNQLDEFMSSK